MIFLHIEDNEADRELTEAMIDRTAHWLYRGAPDVRSGRVSFDARQPDIVLVDVHFPNRPDSESYDVMEQMTKMGVPVIALSGDCGQEVVSHCHRAGAVAFVNKKDMGSPQAFYDTIMAAVDSHMRRATSGEIAPFVALLDNLGKAVLYGNGEPGLVSRVAIVETKVDEMQKSQDRKFDAIFDKLERGVLLDILKFIAQMATIILTGIAVIYQIHAGQHPSISMSSVPGIEEDK